MSTTYYNEEYSPISDDYRAAEIRENEVNSQQETVQRKKNNTKRHSKYDSNMYALPDNEDDASSLPHPPPLQSRKLLFWKVATGALAFALLGETVALVVCWTSSYPILKCVFKTIYRLNNYYYLMIREYLNSSSISVIELHLIS